VQLPRYRKDNAWLEGCLETVREEIAYGTADLL
jgi:hypothetical protein